MPASAATSRSSASTSFSAARIAVSKVSVLVVPLGRRLRRRPTPRYRQGGRTDAVPPQRIDAGREPRVERQDPGGAVAREATQRRLVGLRHRLGQRDLGARASGGEHDVAVDAWIVRAQAPQRAVRENLLRMSVGQLQQPRRRRSGHLRLDPLRQRGAPGARHLRDDGRGDGGQRGGDPAQATPLIVFCVRMRCAPS